jgi:hypothetical protein
VGVVRPQGLVAWNSPIRRRSQEEEKPRASDNGRGFSQEMKRIRMIETARSSHGDINYLLSAPGAPAKKKPRLREKTGP